MQALICVPVTHCGSKKNRNWKAPKCKPSAKCACAIPLIDGLGLLVRVYTRDLPLVALWHGLATVACGSRYTPFVVTSCASEVHRASGSGRGKLVLISILACSLGFHAITSERGTFTKIAILKSSQCSAERIGVAIFGGRKSGNWDRRDPDQ